MERNSLLSTNSLAFIALSNEYCATVESVDQIGRDDFIAAMLKLLPRLYMSATDLRTDGPADECAYIDGVLDEDYYESVRRRMELTLGEDDAYLEVFEDDMKYSDSPIAASIAEGLSDIFQVLYNFLETVRDAPDETMIAALAAVKDDFGHYWSRPLCNVLRALNRIRYKED